MARKSTKGPKPVTVKELPPRVWTNRDGSQGIAYPLRYTDPETGKVLRPQYRTKADRTRKRIQIESELLKGVHVPLRDRPTLAEFAWHYYDERKGDGLTRASLESIENRLRLHILGGGRDTKPGQYLYLGDCVMAELKQFEIREWANDIEGKIPPLHLRRKREYRPEKRPYTPPRSRRLVIAAKELLTEMFAAAMNDERTGVHRNVAALVKIKDAAAKRKSQLVHAGTDFMTPEEAEMLLRYFRRQATTQTGWY